MANECAACGVSVHVATICDWDNETDLCYDCLLQENARLKKAINDFGNNPAGFDWAVLARLDGLEQENERLLDKPLIAGPRCKHGLPVGMWCEECHRASQGLKQQLLFDTPKNAQLLQLADKHPAPQEWYDEDSQSRIVNQNNSPETVREGESIRDSASEGNRGVQAG